MIQNRARPLLLLGESAGSSTTSPGSAEKRDAREPGPPLDTNRAREVRKKSSAEIFQVDRLYKLKLVTELRDGRDIEIYVQKFCPGPRVQPWKICGIAPLEGGVIKDLLLSDCYDIREVAPEVMEITATEALYPPWRNGFLEKRR